MSDPFAPEQADPASPDTVLDTVDTDEPATPEPAITHLDAEIQYAPTVVNSQAHEKIQAGERAQGVGLTVDVSQQ